MTLRWIEPLALFGLLAAALPVIIHLLRRQRAVRVPFPTLRFLTDSRAAAVRLRSLSDPLLLVIRVATIVAAVLAAAQPQLLTSWRRAAADARTSRAIVVDNSASMPALARQRDEAVAQERRASAALIELPASRVGASLCAAAAALVDGPVARHEIVVISDFLHGAVNDADVACVPPDVGLRFVPVGSEHIKAGETLVGLALDGLAIRQRAEFEGARTRVTTTSGPADATRQPTVFVPAGDVQAGSRLLRAVARAGAPAMDGRRPLAFIFPGTPSLVVTPVRAPWMLAALVAARESETMRAAAATFRGEGLPSSSPAWTPIARAASGAPLVSAAADGERMIVAVSAAPAELLSVVVVHTVLTASVAIPNWNELEVERIPAARLQAWSRPAGPIPPERLKPAAPGDARWLWAVTLLLLGVEWAVRRERTAVTRSEARAA